MRRLFRPGLWLAPALAAGCAPPDEIRTYTVAKATAPAAENYRILGGMFPAENPQWFFKLTGRDKQLEPHKAEVDAFLASVKLPEKEGDLPAWSPPAGWKSVPPSGGNFGPAAVFQIGPLEMKVSRAMGGADANIKRWAEQTGAPADDLKRYTKPVAGGLAVDIVGPKNPGGGGPMMMGGGK